MSRETMSATARELVNAGRSAFSPSASDMARVQAKLAARLALPATTVAAGTLKATGIGLSAKISVVAVVITVAGLGAARVLSHQSTPIGSPRQAAHTAAPTARSTRTSDPRPQTASPAIAPVTSPTRERREPTSASFPSHNITARVSPQGAFRPANIESTPASIAPNATPSTPAPTQPADEANTLNELPAIGIRAEPVRAPTVAVAAPIEVTAPEAASDVPAPRVPRAWTLFSEQQFLQAARIEMATGHPDRALVLLDEEAVRFPHGVLRVARHSVRTLVLCMQGRNEEARIEAAAVLRREPVGPHADMVRGSCAGLQAP